MVTELQSQYNSLIIVYLTMFRRIGMSLLLSWTCLNAYAQLPHPNDTLENGKKVPFNQFLGRLSFYSEGFGAGLVYSLNSGYSVISTELITLDYTIGGSRLPMVSANPLVLEPEDYLKMSTGVRLLVGRRKSRLTVKAGYAGSLQTGWLSGNTNYPSCAGVCAGPTQHMFAFSLGYTYQHHYGIFFGVHTYGLVQMTPRNDRWLGAPSEDFMPWPGVTLGYRLPSRQLKREWLERSFKRRVLRVEQPKEKRKEVDEIDDAFYTDKPLEVDSTELQEIQDELAKLKKRHDRYLKEEQRLNGRSLIYAEFFGATGIASVNYTYTHPIAKSNIFMMEYRGGFGADRHNLQLPLHVGFKAMKNYRGTGVFLGLEPQYDPKTGKFGAVYFLEHNVEFHFAYGLTGGVAFYLFYDPMYYKNHWNFSPYGSFFLGYRLPEMNK